MMIVYLMCMFFIHFVCSSDEDDINISKIVDISIERQDLKQNKEEPDISKMVDMIESQELNQITKVPSESRSNSFDSQDSSSNLNSENDIYMNFKDETAENQFVLTDMNRSTDNTLHNVVPTNEDELNPENSN